MCQLSRILFRHQGLSNNSTQVSSLGAYMTNYVGYTMMGKYSILVFQVVAHGKTLFVLAGGWLWFDKSATVQSDTPEERVRVYKYYLGFALALFGIILYSYGKEQARKHAVNEAKGEGGETKKEK